MSVMIKAENLGRYFGDIKAVDGLSFEVHKGDVLGFLGPNGAGKSTTMKMLTCFLTPSYGTAKVAGYDILEQSREVRAAIGYLPESAPLYGEMEVRQFLQFIADVRGVDPAKKSSSIDRVVELTTLGGVLNQKIETLSKGFRRRVGLAQALVHDPEILVLDEPTDGLDPNQKHEVRSLIRMMAADKCILLSTHILEEVDAVCNRAIIIAKGKILADEKPDALRRRAPSFGAVTLSFAELPGDTVVSRLRALNGVARVEQVKDLHGDVNYTLYPHNGVELLSTVVKEVDSMNLRCNDLRLDNGQLDEVFRDITS